MAISISSATSKEEVVCYQCTEITSKDSVWPVIDAFQASKVLPAVP